MKKLTLIILTLLLSLYTNAQSVSQDYSVVKNAIFISHHKVDGQKTFYLALKMSDMLPILEQKGPFTVFEPSDSAFTNIPAKSLLKNDDINHSHLKSVIKSHIVKGSYKKEDLLKMIKLSNGKATLTTINGDTLEFTSQYGDIKIEDKYANTSKLIIKDVNSKNGVVHTIDKVLLH